MPEPSPIVAVLAVVARKDEVLLVRRANPPDAGLWGFPGGKVDFGEALTRAAERELLEETGVRASAGRVIEALDVWDRADDGTLHRHFVLIAVLCDWQTGEPVAADDALEARWVPIEGIAMLETSADVERVARTALAAGA